MDKYTSAVEKGIEFLNENVPDWRKAIKLESLDLRDCKACILGQLYGDYFDTLGLIIEDDNAALELGFIYDDDDDDELLTETWKLALDK